MLLLLLLNCFNCVRLCTTPETAAHRLPRPWDSPGKNTGVGCRFLLQCMNVKNESEVAQSCPTPSDSMDCSLPGSSIHGIFQARVLEWGAIAFSVACCNSWDRKESGTTVLLNWTELKVPSAILSFELMRNILRAKGSWFLAVREGSYKYVIGKV